MNRRMENELFSLKDSYILRGVAIIMVTFSHYVVWVSEWLMKPLLTDALSRLGCYGVDIFFLLSGYALCKTTQGKKVDLSFALRRLKNMYLPYLLIAGIIELSAGGITTLNGLRKYLLGEDYWFIFNILIFYIAFFVIWRIGKLRLLLMGLFTLGFSYLLYRNGRQDFWYVSNAAFFLGILAGKYEQKLCRLISRLYPLVLAVLIAGMGIFVYLGLSSSAKLLIYPWELHLQFLANLWWTVLVIYSARLVVYHGPVLQFLGKHSLYLYMLHTFVYFQVLNLFTFKLSWVLSHGEQPWVLLCAIVITVISGWILKVLCDRIFVFVEKLISRRKRNINE